MASQIHDLVSNDPILDSKVVPDELGQLAEPGRPVPPASRWAALQGGGGEEGRAKEGGSAHQNPAPPLLSPQVGYLV